MKKFLRNITAVALVLSLSLLSLTAIYSVNSSGTAIDFEIIYKGHNNDGEFRNICPEEDLYTSGFYLFDEEESLELLGKVNDGVLSYGRLGDEYSIDAEKQCLAVVSILFSHYPGDIIERTELSELVLRDGNIIATVTDDYGTTLGYDTLTAFRFIVVLEKEQLVTLSEDSRYFLTFEYLSFNEIEDDLCLPENWSSNAVDYGTNVVKKFTPVVDGVIEDEYLSSFHIDHEWPEERTPEHYWAVGRYAFDRETGETVYGWDAQASSYFLWDADNLYIAVDVTDDDYGSIDDEHYQFARDGGLEEYPEGPAWQDSVHLALSLGESKFWIYILRDGRAIYSEADGGDGTVWCDCLDWGDYCAETDPSAIGSGAVVETEKGYTVELQLPVKEEYKTDLLCDAGSFGYSVSVVDAPSDSEYYFEVNLQMTVRETCFFEDYMVLFANYNFSEAMPDLTLTLSEDGAIPLPPYDLTADGVFDTKDLTRLMRYVAGDSAAVVAQSADINGDGAVDVKDLTRMMKLLAAV